MDLDIDMETKKAQREMQIDKLLEFNRNELSKLIEQRDLLDIKLHDARRRAAESADRVAACRALVAARMKGAVLHSPKNLDNAARALKAKGIEKDSSVNSNMNMRNMGTIEPIGIIYTNLQKRFHAPRQSFTGTPGCGEIHLERSISDISRITGIKRGDRLVVTYWFDRNGTHWREFVRPPRLIRGRIGVFATRSPNRPTPVGLSLCEVTSVDINRNVIHCSGVDILDETPILGIRAYCRTKDSFSGEGVRSGWLDDEEKIRPLHYDDAAVRLRVAMCPVGHVAEKLDFLELRDIVVNSLERQLGTPVGKKPKKEDGYSYGILPMGAFRVLYKRNKEQQNGDVTVVDVISGFRDEVCREEADVDPEAALHAEFKRKYPCNEEILWNWGKD